LSSQTEVTRLLLAYFSHSYRPRPEEKKINLFFWEMLSRHGLYFTTEAEESRNRPMDITYLEWMMRRSACFVAVIPWRDDSPPYNCSPYQVFENGLAIRAQKPRLLFVEVGLDATRMGIEPEEVLPFQRRLEWLEADRYKFEEAVARLAKRAHAFSTPVALANPVGLIIDAVRGPAYTNSLVRSVGHLVNNLGYSFEVIHPSEFENDYLFLRKIERCNVLISEIRKPYLAPDIFGLLHSRCLPMIRICHLNDNESMAEVKLAMHLASDISTWTDQDTYELPLVLSKYELDSAMQPVIFWEKPEELIEKITFTLKKIKEQRYDLLHEQEARDYFLQIGRLKGQVFISNAKSQNILVGNLKRGFTREAVRLFHYQESAAIKIGSSNWLSEIMLEIRNSILFIALVDSDYLQSEWCEQELSSALDLCRNGEIELHVYIVDKNVRLPEELKMMQISFLEDLEESGRIEKITANTVDFLENGGRVRLRSIDREQLEKLLMSQPLLALPETRKQLLQNAGLSEGIIDTIRTNAETPEQAAHEMIQDLASVGQLSGSVRNPRASVRALGLFISHLMTLMKTQSEQALLAELTRYYRLMPVIGSGSDQVQGYKDWNAYT
jgi:hypothetical protein